MTATAAEAIAFLEQQRIKMGADFPTRPPDSVLSFLGTTHSSGVHASLSVHRLLKIVPGASGREVKVHLAGKLPRPLKKGESLTVSVVKYPEYKGYQVKTLELKAPEFQSQLISQVGPDELVVHGSQVFTVHNSPNVVRLFEQVPFTELQKTLEGAEFAVLGIGPMVNISHRLIHHFEIKDGRLAVFNGDGFANKTYLNLKSNKADTRLVIDLQSFQGFSLEGQNEEITRADHALGFDKVTAGFQLGGWGTPAHVHRLSAERISRVAP